MARLPQPGGDIGNWGSVLNDFLQVSHNTDGTLKGIHFNVKDYGAKGDGQTDDTAAILAAVNAVKAVSTGIVFFPSGTYNHTGINLDDISTGLTLRGVGSQTAGGSECVLNFTEASGAAISARASFGITIQGLLITHSNAAYADNLINLDWSDKQRDPAYFRLEDCIITSKGTPGARSLVRLNKTLLSTISRCTFKGGQTQILGMDTSYSNVIGIRDCTFTDATVVPIKNAGEKWTIDSCGFEPMTGSRSGAYASDSTSFSYSLAINNCWFGDATQPGSTWVDMSGGRGVLGMTLMGNRFAKGGENILVKIGYVQGLLVAGNRFEGAIQFTAKYARGVTFVGNDFQSSNPLLNTEKAIYLSTMGNNNFGNTFDRKLTVSDKVLAEGGIGVGNSIPASKPGAIIKKVEIFDANGVRLGFIPIYDNIA